MSQSYQQTHRSLNQLKSFLSTVSSDPYWTSILQSDIRNIFPKHEVCKIQGLKNSISKTRLILQNLNTFVSLERQKKQLETEMIDLGENLVMELREVMVQDQKRHGHYNTDIIRRRKQLQSLHKQLTKPVVSPQTVSYLQNNPNWEQYLKKHLTPTHTPQPQHLTQDILNLLSTSESILSLIDTNNPNTLILSNPNYTKIYEQKLKEKIFIQSLVEDIYEKQVKVLNDQSQEIGENNHNEQFWKQKVQHIRQVYKI